MRTQLVTAVGHVALRVRDIEASARYATEIMGLRISERRPGALDLTHATCHHSLQYISAETDALDHIGVEAAHPAALDELRGRVLDAGLSIISDHPFDAALDRGFVFEAHEGFLFEAYIGMRQDQPQYKALGVRPSRFGHINITCEFPARMTQTLVDVMGFRVSDEVAGGSFLRCNVDHHGVAILPGSPRLHHHAWEVQSIHDLGHIADRIHEDGGSILWGPVRHGIGRNIAVYFEDPCGVVVEYYTDMQRIYDEESYEPQVWSTDGHKWLSFWAPMRSPGFAERGVPTLRSSRSEAQSSLED